MKSLVYKPEMQSVCDFLGRDNIDADPPHQRPQIQDNNKKMGIVEAMMSGIDIGEVKLNQTSEDPEELEVIEKYLHSIDNPYRRVPYNEHFQTYHQYYAAQHSCSDDSFSVISCFKLNGSINNY